MKTSTVQVITGPSFLTEWQETRFLWLENSKINMKPQVSQLLGQAIKTRMT